MAVSFLASDLVKCCADFCDAWVFKAKHRFSEWQQVDHGLMQVFGCGDQAGVGFGGFWVMVTITVLR